MLRLFVQTYLRFGTSRLGQRLEQLLPRAEDDLGRRQLGGQWQPFGDRRPDRIVWKDRQWEWASLRFEDGDFSTNGRIDTDAREKWFYQAIGASPAMFRRDPQAGSLYWLGLRDKTTDYLDGGKHYVLHVPLPVPGKLFWSVTVYDTETHWPIQTSQKKAALRSLFELKDVKGKAAELGSIAGRTQRQGAADGSRPSLARAGLSISASTDLKPRPSMEAGSRAISNVRPEADA